MKKYDQCAKIETRFLKSNISLVAHQNYAHKAIDEKYTCKKCQKIFGNKNNLRRHIKVNHEGQRHKCQKCNKELTSKTILAKHEKIFHTKD